MASVAALGEYGGTTYLVKCTLEPPLAFSTVVPLLVDNSEGEVLIRGSSREPNETCVLLACLCGRLTALATVLTLNAVGRAFGFVNQIGVKDVELVTLYNLGWRVVVVIVSLVVFVPFVPHLDSVEVPWFARSVLALPLRTRARAHGLFASEDLLILTDSLGEFSLIKRFGGL